MNTVTNSAKLALMCSLIACAFGFASFAFAETNTSAGASASTSIKTNNVRLQLDAKASVQARTAEEKMVQAKARAKQELERRIAGLNKLIVRLGDAKRVSADAKASLTADVNAQISALTALNTKIQGETATSTLKTDIQSITGSYRIYALIIPKGHILAAADRIKVTADLMTSAAAKLRTGIDKAKSAGKDVASLEAQYADLLSKTADAKVQADAAIALVTPLKPDLKNNVVFEANKKALQEARAKLRAGSAALKTARDDAHKILTSLKQMGVYAKGSASASSTVTQ